MRPGARQRWRPAIFAFWCATAGDPAMLDDDGPRYTEEGQRLAESAKTMPWSRGDVPADEPPRDEPESAVAS